MAKPTRKLDAYVRVSRRAGRKDENFLSPELQSEKIQKWADLHGYELEWHEPEIDKSGGTMNRPVFNEILRRIRAGESDGIIVAKLNRFARTFVSAITTIEEIVKFGAIFVSVEESIDLSTSTGRAFLKMMLVFGELERERIKEGHEESAINAVREGKKVGATKFGYDRVEGRLVPNDWAPTVREAFERAAKAVSQGMDLGGVTKWLEEAAPAFYWDSNHVRTMLECRTYLGEVWWGEHCNKKAHEAIVTRQLFEAAQRPTRACRRSSAYPLSGIATCATCGAHLVGGHTDVRTYACSNKTKKGGTCKRPVSIRAAMLEEFCRERLLQVWKDGWKASKLVPADLTVGLQVLEEAEEELRAFASDLTARRLLGSDYHGQLEIRVQARDAAQAAYREQFKGDAEVEHIDAAALAESATTEELRNLMAAAFETIAVKAVGRGKRVGAAKRVLLVMHGADSGVATGAEDLPSSKVKAAA